MLCNKTSVKLIMSEHCFFFLINGYTIHHAKLSYL
jgi:hypothetical protein